MSLRERLVRALIIVSKDGVFTRESLKAVSGVSDSAIEDFINSLMSDGVLVRVGDGYKSVMPPHRLIRYFVGKGGCLLTLSLYRGTCRGMSLRP